MSESKNLFGVSYVCCESCGYEEPMQETIYGYDLPSGWLHIRDINQDFCVECRSQATFNLETLANKKDAVVTKSER